MDCGTEDWSFYHRPSKGLNSVKGSTCAKLMNSLKHHSIIRGSIVGKSIIGPKLISDFLEKDTVYTMLKVVQKKKYLTSCNTTEH